MSNADQPQGDRVALASLDTLLGQPCPMEFKMFHAAGASLIRYEVDGSEWTFPSPAKLIEVISVGRRNQPYVRQLEGYALILAQRTSAESVSIDQGGEMALTRLRAAWAIADSDGDLLFLDPGSDFSVWVFFHEGPAVRRVASSLYEWVAKAKKRVPESYAQNISGEVLKLCIEDALRDYARHVLIPRGLIKGEEFLASIAGHTVFNRKEGAVVERLAELSVRLHELDPQKDREVRDRIFDEISRLGR